MGPGDPSLAVFLRGSLGPVPWLFFPLHDHLTRVHQTFCSLPWLGASLALPRALGFASHVTRLCFSRGPLRWLCPPSPALDMPVSSLSRRFLVSACARLPRSFASSRLTASFSGRRRPPRVTFALLCARLLVWSVPPAPSCGSSQRPGLRGVVPGPAPKR